MIDHESYNYIKPSLYAKRKYENKNRPTSINGIQTAQKKTHNNQNLEMIDSNVYHKYYEIENKSESENWRSQYKLPIINEKESIFKVDSRI